MRAFITDPAGAEAYPIATFTWMVFYEHGQDAAKVAAIKEMIEYGLTEGQEMAEELGYIPMPESGHREGPRRGRRTSAPAPDRRPASALHGRRDPRRPSPSRGPR